MSLAGEKILEKTTDASSPQARMNGAGAVPMHDLELAAAPVRAGTAQQINQIHKVGHLHPVNASENGRLGYRGGLRMTPYRIWTQNCTAHAVNRHFGAASGLGAYGRRTYTHFPELR